MTKCATVSQGLGIWLLAFFVASPFAEAAKKQEPKERKVPSAEVLERAELQGAIERFDPQALRLALRDMARSGSRELWNERVQREVDAIEKELPKLREGVVKKDAKAIRRADEIIAYQREMLLSNPLLDVDRIVLVKRDFSREKARSLMGGSFGRPKLNSHVLTSVSRTGWNNEIAVLSGLRTPEPMLQTLHKPDKDVLLCDIDLNFDAERMIFTQLGSNDCWQIFEIGADGKGLKQLTPNDLQDVDFFDSCYLANDEVLMNSTAAFQGLPCENGSKYMAQLYRLNPENGEIRQLCFEQDSNWTPTMMNDGRVLYTRWEYSDMPHYFSRIVMAMNPDGTAQKAQYGSNSYFPNTTIFMKALPGSNTRFIGMVGGHHGISHSGRLIIFDTNEGTHEADGAVQEIPGRGKKVEALMIDRLVDKVWPQFTHPYPLDDKYFLVTAKPSKNSLWGIYLVDVFDNMTLIKQLEGSLLLEPILLQSTVRPPVIPDRHIEGEKEASVYIANVNFGPGLEGIPAGKVKNLRLFSYHYAHKGAGGHNSVGVESSWDVKRVLGTVPVQKDGSASFMVPANTPISIQPLDEDGSALQLMRSWFVGMPGEAVSCSGCHEDLNAAPPMEAGIARSLPPATIKPWHGAARPFSFKYEVQPVLDRNCTGCHNGKDSAIPDFRASEEVPHLENAKKQRFRNLSPSYVALQAYVRRPGPESDLRLTNPMEYHVSTSELIQLLRKGHKNVKLDDEAWSRLTTWIDLNAPYRGHWSPPEVGGSDQQQRRVELATCYANTTVDVEAEYQKLASVERPKVEPVRPEPVKRPLALRTEGWPLAAQKPGETVELELGNGNKLEFVRIPAGSFVMGDVRASRDEFPQAVVKIDKPFWMSTKEITNQLFAEFDASHDSRFIDRRGKDHNNRGTAANQPEQPVCRVSWQQAVEFCKWAAKKSGKSVKLPTEAQWEWACRAGTDTPFWFGSMREEFVKFANLADKSVCKGEPGATMDYYIAKHPESHDKAAATVAPGSYEANPWGLFDMHGNVAEWTRSSYRPYPYAADDGRNDLDPGEQKVCRGGSWRDRRYRSTSAYRIPYESYQKVVNVGFRVIVEE